MKRYVLLILFLVLTLFQLFQIVNLNKNVTDLSASEQMLYRQNKLLEHNIEPISFLLTLNRYIDNVFIPYMTNSSQVESYLNIVEECLFNN